MVTFVCTMLPAPAAICSASRSASMMSAPSARAWSSRNAPASATYAPGDIGCPKIAS